MLFPSPWQHIWAGLRGLFIQNKSEGLSHDQNLYCIRQSLYEPEGLSAFGIIDGCSLSLSLMSWEYWMWLGRIWGCVFLAEGCNQSSWGVAGAEVAKKSNFQHLSCSLPLTVHAGLFPIFFPFYPVFPSPGPVCPVTSSHSLTCNCFPSGTADPKDMIHLLPPFLNLPVQELTSENILFRLTSDLSAPRADPEPKTGIRDLLIFIASWLEMRSPKGQTPTIPSLLYSLKSDPSFATSQLLLPCVDALPSSLQLLVQKPREEQLLAAFCSFTAN